MLAGAAAAGMVAVGLAAGTGSAAATPMRGSLYWFEPPHDLDPDGTVVVATFTESDSGSAALQNATLGEFSQDGARVAYADQVTGPGRTYLRIEVSDPDGGAATAVTAPDPATQSDSGPHWGPDGTLLFTRLTTGPSGTSTAVWSVRPDGTQAHAVLPDTTVWAVNPKSGDVLTGTGTGGVTDLRTRNASGGYDAPRPLPQPMRGAADAAFSPDGGKVAFSQGGRLYLGGADASALREVMVGVCANIRAFAWGPQGDRFAVSSDTDGAAVVGLSGESLRRYAMVPGPSGTEGRFHWRPDSAPGPATPPPPVNRPQPPARFVTETPAVMSVGTSGYGEKCTAVFARSAADQSLWMHMYREYEGAWSDWVRIGGPAADLNLYRPNGLLVARGPVDKAVFATTVSTFFGQWEPWHRIGGPAADVSIMRGPAPIKGSPSSVILARDPNSLVINALTLSAYQPLGTPPPWERFGGPAAEVDVAVNPAGTTYVVARDPSDGSVHAKELPAMQGNPGRDWHRIGDTARAVSLTSVAENASVNQPVVTAQNPVDGSLWTRVSAAPDAPWRQVGGPSGTFTSARGDTGDFLVLARDGTTGALYISPKNHVVGGQWTPQPWHRVDLPAGAALPVVEGRTLTTVDANGAVVSKTCTADWNCG